jgi:hypothetical protein
MATQSSRHCSCAAWDFWSVTCPLEAAMKTDPMIALAYEIVRNSVRITDHEEVISIETRGR